MTERRVEIYATSATEEEEKGNYRVEFVEIVATGDEVEVNTKRVEFYDHLGGIFALEVSNWVNLD
jgi:hypothetical protein